MPQFKGYTYRIHLLDIDWADSGKSTVTIKNMKIKEFCLIHYCNIHALLKINFSPHHSDEPVIPRNTHHNRAAQSLDLVYKTFQCGDSVRTQSVSK